MSTSALSIAVSALRAHSYAIETTSHNIANAGTAGFRRQRVDMAAAAPRVGAVGLMGAGVEARTISRATDRLADLRARGASGQAAFATVRADIAAMSEVVFGEPDDGINTSLSGMWESFSTLALRPSDSAARYQVMAGLNDVASRVNDVRGGLARLSDDAMVRLGSEVQEANALMERVVELNALARDANGMPADLADERDRTIDRLSTLLGARADVEDDGRVRMFVNGVTIVEGNRFSELTVPGTPVGQVNHPSGPMTFGGSIGGTQTALTVDIANQRAQLDSFVSGLVSALNTTHVSGYTPGGATGGPLLTDAGGVLSVAITSTADIAASDIPNGVQNGRVADALAQLRDGQGGAFRAVVTSLSGMVAALGRSADTANSVADSAALDRESITGVNLDEEMTNLVGQQRAYEAAARIVTVVDEMLRTLIQM